MTSQFDQSVPLNFKQKYSYFFGVMQSTPSAHLVLDLLFQAFQLDSIVIFNI